jgi:arylsulfatase
MPHTSTHRDAERATNIVLILTDQQRGDCIGLDGHPAVQTPNLDWLGRSGSLFQRAYSECPSCIPARRVLMSGQAPDVNGMVGMQGGIPFEPPHTLAGELSNAGYQTEMIGKLHLHPQRKRFGFDHMQLADGTRGEQDYLHWLRAKGWSAVSDPGMAHGLSSNGWVGRPHHLPEELMHSTWCVNQALEFLERRDPTAPFFLNVSFIDPHPPLAPPQLYYDRYINRDLPEPVIGDWAEPMEPERGFSPNAQHMRLDPEQMRCTRAAYYGMINFVDDQIGRLIQTLGDKGLLRDTFFLFTSDHGEMLGDHNMFRKTYAYEGSARVPFIAKAPDSLGMPSNVVNTAPVGWQDIMPTLLDAAGLDVPDSVTGRSVLPHMRGETDVVWRDVLHGEDSGTYGPDYAMHYLTDGAWKYVWYSQSGREHLFDLENDPNELRDLALQPAADQTLNPWRVRLAQQLRDRPETFVRDEALVTGAPHERMVPGRA